MRAAQRRFRKKHRRMGSSERKRQTMKEVVVNDKGRAKQRQRQTWEK